MVGESLKPPGGVFCNPDLPRITYYNQGVVLGLQAAGVVLSSYGSALTQTVGPNGPYPNMAPLPYIGRAVDRKA